MIRIRLLLVISEFATALPVAKKVQCEGGYYGICEEEEEDEGLPLSREADSVDDETFPEDKEENNPGIADLFHDAF